MKYELYRLDTHPLARKFYDLGIEIEKLPGDIRQTDLVRKLSELRQQTQDLMNDPDFQAKMDAQEPLTDVQRSIRNGTFGVRSEYDRQKDIDAEGQRASR